MCKALKENFLMNALDGSEDMLVRDKLFELVGEEVTTFRHELMEAPPHRLISEMINTITPPQGVKIKDDANNPPDEGLELLDGEFEEDLCLEVEEEGEGLACDANVQPCTSTSTSTDARNTGKPEGNLLPTTTTCEDINKDGDFLNELGSLLEKYSSGTTCTSTQQLPHMLHLRAAYTKARRSLKKRITNLTQDSQESYKR